MYLEPGSLQTQRRQTWTDSDFNIVMTLGDVATVDHLKTPNGTPRGNYSKSTLVD